MGGYGHDGSRPIFHQDEIADPDGELFVIERIDGVAAGEEADFFCGSQVFGFDGGLLHVRELGLGLLSDRRTLQEPRDERMCGSEDDGRRAVNGIDARGENFDGLDAGKIGNFKFDACAL